MTLLHGKNYGRPTLDLNFAENKSLIDTVTGRNLITFSRSQSGKEATYVGSDGLIKYAGADEPRFDYNPETGESLGLLIEEQRTNEKTNSNPWSGGTGVTWVSGQTSPTGGIEAYKMQEDTSTDIHGVPIDTGGYSANYNRIFSVFAKAAGNRYLSFWASLDAYPGTNSPECIFDLQDGVVAQNTDSGAAALFTNGSGASIKDFGNGWYRCVVSVNPVSLANRTIYLLMGNSAANDSMSFPGNGSNGILLFGLQKELGSFPTSYIPTSGSTVTRNADEASITGTNFSSWYNQSEGTFFSSAKQEIVYGNSVIGIGAGSGSIYQFGNTLAEWWNGSDLLSGINAGSGGWTTGAKIAAAYTPSNRYACFNSGLVASNTSSLPNGGKLEIGRQYNTTGAKRVTISRLTYWPKRLPDLELQQLTK
jgi:hypothetical protein